MVTEVGSGTGNNQLLVMTLASRFLDQFTCSSDIDHNSECGLVIYLFIGSSVTDAVHFQHQPTNTLC